MILYKSNKPKVQKLEILLYNKEPQDTILQTEKIQSIYVSISNSTLALSADSYLNNSSANQLSVLVHGLIES